MARRVRVAVSPLAVGEIELDEEHSRYLARVHRLREGDRIVAFDPVARVEADGEIVSSSSRRVRCRFESIRPSQHVSELNVTLFQALGKGDKADRVIRDATQLGASSIVLVTTERSVPRSASDARGDRWTTIAIEAARQSGRGDVPAIVGPVPLAEALSRADVSKHRVVLDPGAEKTLFEVLADYRRGETLALFIGPEGGLSEDELARLEGQGFVRARFGPFTLRTETAATSVLGALVALAEVR